MQNIKIKLNILEHISARILQYFLFVKTKCV